LFLGLSFCGTLVQVLIYRIGTQFKFLQQVTGRAALGGDQDLMTSFAGCLPKSSTKKKIQEMNGIYSESKIWQ